MATYHGNDGVVMNGSVAIAELLNFEHTNTVDTVDDSSAGDTARTRKAGKKDGSGSIDCHFDPTNTTGQGTLVEGASVTLNMYPSGNQTGEGKLSGTVIIKSVSYKQDQDQIVGATFSYEGYCPLTLVTP
ncbi:MAG TPA: hypothetical protein DCQ64_30970 [Candidatus Rokubacteria bacterium]|nr:hypothetical protein [Candidatus Rokubacteria bacterium]